MAGKVVLVHVHVHVGKEPCTRLCCALETLCECAQRMRLSRLCADATVSARPMSPQRVFSFRSNMYLSRIGVVTNGDVCIGSSLQHSDVGGVKGRCRKAVSNGIHISAHSMMCRCSVAVQHGIESTVFHLHVDCPAVLISCLLVPLLLEGCVAGLPHADK